MASFLLALRSKRRLSSERHLGSIVPEQVKAERGKDCLEQTQSKVAWLVMFISCQAAGDVNGFL